MSSVNTMSTTAISAVYLQNTQYENMLNVLLVPPNEIRGDVRTLAGLLDFTMAEVNYIMEKKYPFVYLVDSWINRVGAEIATLQCLQVKLEELGRLDAVEEIKKAIDELKQKSPDDLDKIANKHNSKLRRSESCLSLCPSAKMYFVDDDIPCGDKVDLPSTESNMSFEKNVKKSRFSWKFGSLGSLNEKKHPVVEKHTRNTRNSSKSAKHSNEKESEESPTVYVVYTTEDIEHLKAIRDLVEKLHDEYGIDVKCELYESSAYDENKAYYIYSNLINAEYVLYVCTEATNADAEEDSETNKKAQYIKKFALDFIFEDSSYKSKYIPVLLPGCTRKDIPYFLSGSTPYPMENNDFYDNVYRRIFRIEKYKLGALPEKKPTLKPIDISALF